MCLCEEEESIRDREVYGPKPKNHVIVCFLNFYPADTCSITVGTHHILKASQRSGKIRKYRKHLNEGSMLLAR